MKDFGDQLVGRAKTNHQSFDTGFLQHPVGFLLVGRAKNDAFHLD